MRAALFFLTLSLTWGTSAAWAAQAPVREVFVVPHPDDEVLTMGAALRASVLAGHDVDVVLVTDGSRPGRAAIRGVNERLAAEGFPPLTEGAPMAAARDAEFVAALGRLGVPAERVHRVGVTDGTLSRAQASEVVSAWASQVPNAILTSMSWLDIHPDHYRLGYALDAYCSSHPSRTCRFAQYQRFVKGSEAPSSSPVVSPPGSWTFCDDAVHDAANEYRTWDPRNGRYGIGWLFSVPAQFDFLLTHCRSWVHSGARTWASDADRVEAASWAEKNQAAGRQQSETEP